jgi:ubiquinone/menaquinone biosynthesis C-methylase UbiE
MAETRHRDNHRWDSQDYVAQWAERQATREAGREEAFRLMAEAIPYDKEMPIRFLDIGAGYGALTRFLLERFPNATAVCQDGSAEMMNLGTERMADFKGRFAYVLCDFSKPGWSQNIAGPFEAVVSAIAIHNVRSPEIIEAIYNEIFPLIKSGGCFLNFDRTNSPLEEQFTWLRAAGFQNARSFWQEEKRALFGGFKA